MLQQVKTQHTARWETPTNTAGDSNNQVPDDITREGHLPPDRAKASCFLCFPVFLLSLLLYVHILSSYSLVLLLYFTISTYFTRKYTFSTIMSNYTFHFSSLSGYHPQDLFCVSSCLVRFSFTNCKEKLYEVKCFSTPTTHSEQNAMCWVVTEQLSVHSHAFFSCLLTLLLTDEGC